MRSCARLGDSAMAVHWAIGKAVMVGESVIAMSLLQARQPHRLLLLVGQLASARIRSPPALTPVENTASHSTQLSRAGWTTETARRRQQCPQARQG